MVLAELGGKLRDSLRKLQSEDNIDKSTVSTLVNEIVRALMEADVNVKLCMTLRNNIQDRVLSSLSSNNNNNSNNNESSNVGKLVQKAVVEELTALVSTSARPYKLRRNKPNVILFVGLQGAGKTTTIAKFAQYYSRKGWKVCMVCADTFRAGAFDQLKQNATKLRIPFYGSYAEADPVSIAQRGVDQFIAEHYEVILVDTSGRHRQEGALLEEMQEISNAVNPDDTVFVMDATQGQAIYEQASAFREAVSVGSVIVTKLDGHAKGGGALSAVAATQSPILFLGSGEHFDDLTPFYAPSFVQQLLGLGGGIMEGYMREMEDLRDNKSQKEMMQKMKKGEFTLRDMYSQFQKTMQMGGMGKMMSGMAGNAMPEYLMPNSEDSTRRLKTFLYIMDSMTNAELDGKVDMHTTKDVESRIRRIARGSGTHPKEVQLLLQTHKQMQSFVSKSSKAMKGGAGTTRQRQMMQEQFKKNPNAMMQQLNKTNPQLVQQMGGSANMMKMMQQMGGPGGAGAGGMPGFGGGGAGGMPDMASMAQMMQQMGGGMGGGPSPGAGGMPDMASMAQMMQQMGGGMGGAPSAGAGGGMPDMAQMMKMMQQMKR